MSLLLDWLKKEDTEFWAEYNSLVSEYNYWKDLPDFDSPFIKERLDKMAQELNLREIARELKKENK